MIPKGDYQKSTSDDWATPKWLYNKILENNYLDPCPLHCKENNLLKSYKNQRLYINPPFSKISIWIDWAIDQYNNGCEIIFLMPARTDTKYFHKILKYNPTIIFLKGRLEFNDCGVKAPFPTILLHLNKNNIRTYSTMNV